MKLLELAIIILTENNHVCAEVVNDLVHTYDDLLVNTFQVEQKLYYVILTYFINDDTWY